MCLKQVMLDGCKWLQVVASVCKWLLVDALYTLGTRAAHTLLILHMHECLRLFMDEIFCVITWMLHMDVCDVHTYRCYTLC